MKQRGVPAALEIFAGSGHLSEAWRRSMRLAGHPVFEIDIRHGVEHNVCSKALVKLIRGWVRGGLVMAVFMGTPCNSFSLARNRPNGPPTLRTSEYPEGLPELKDSCRKEVDLGNTLCAASFSIFRECRLLGCPVIVENPASSHLWRQPLVLKVRDLPGVSEVVFNMCAFGTPWRKSTRLLGCHVDLRPLDIRCKGRGVCTFTGSPHFTLEMKGSKIVSKQAEVYPFPVCRAIVNVFRAALLQKRANKFRPHI